MKTNTTQSGVSDDAQDINGSTIDEAADALMNRWNDNESSSDLGEEEVEEEVDEADEADDQEDEEQADDAAEADEDESNEEEDSTEAEETDEADEDDGKQKKPSKTLGDDDEVEIIVNKESKKVAVKDLKRLYGQEASLTKKSQEVAAQRKTVEADATKYAASLDALYKRAQARWEPFSKVDMLVASKELDTETFATLRKEAQEAYDEFQFVSTESNKFVQDAETKRQEVIRTQAATAVETLKAKVPNWSDELYNRIRKFAVDSGMDQNFVNNLVDPNVIMLINKARMHDQAKKVILKKKVKTPSKVIKSGNTQASDVAPNKAQAAINKARASGDTDSAADAFLARWNA